MDEKEERKRLRRDRIRRRYDNSPREAANLSLVDKSIDEDEKETSEHQISESLAHLTRKKKESIETITRFRISVFQCETERRCLEEVSREERHQLTQTSDENPNHNTKSQSRNNLSWDSIIEIDNPMELHKAMEEMRSLYEDMIDKNDVIINELKRNLIMKDEEYLDNLRKQNDVTSRLQLSMDRAIEDLQTHYYNELKSIEDTLVDDRARRIEKQVGATKELVENKAKNIEHNLQELMKRKEEKQNVVMCNQDKATQAYNDLKNNIYAKVNKLECELAISRGIYQVNSDQIEYNQRATAAKNTENEEKVKKRKKRILMYKEELSKELEQSKTSELKEKRRNDILDQDCRRLEGQYNNLLSKLHRFEIVEEQKYTAAAVMHQEEINILSKRIMDAKEIVANEFDKRLDLFEADGKRTIEESNNPMDTQSSPEKIVMNTRSLPDIWIQLEAMLLQYHELLHDRETLLSNVSVLKKENDDLQLKLDIELKKEINKDLIVPPLPPS